MFKKILTAILEGIFPTMCVSCGAGGDLVCTKCASCIQSEVWIIDKPAPHLDVCVVAADLRNPAVHALVHAVKYQGLRPLIPPLANLLQHALDHAALAKEISLAPIPLHPRKLARRGFNQSELLARELHAARKLPIDRGLRRIRFTQSQTKQNEQDRIKNLANAFTYAGTPPRRVLLIDDVATTFATLDAAAVALRKSGADFVGAAVIAKNFPATRPASTPYQTTSRAA